MSDPHCAPIAVPAERDDDGIWQVYYYAEIRRMGNTQTAWRFQAINEKLKGAGPGKSEDCLKQAGAKPPASGFAVWKCLVRRKISRFFEWTAV